MPAADIAIIDQTRSGEFFKESRQEETDFLGTARSARPTNRFLFRRGKNRFNGIDTPELGPVTAF